MLSALLQLLTSCSFWKPSAPGTSVPLHYPVLLFRDNDFTSRKDEKQLIETNTAVGITYEDYTILDSSGAQYSIRKVTAFNRPRFGDFFSMGTSTFKVFLQLKSHGKPNMAKAKETLNAVAMRSSEIQNKSTATREINAARSFAELVELCSSPWNWR